MVEHAMHENAFGWNAAPADLEAAVEDARRASQRLAPALVELQRAVRHARPERATALAGELGDVHRLVGSVTEDAATLRRWSLEVAHALRSWHPVPPPLAR